MADELTPREVAHELGVTVRTVQRWVSDGRLSARRVGGRVRVSRSSLDAVAPEPRGAREAAQGRTLVQRRIATLLIANRGEIAARIARTARGMGLRTVGVHEAAERPPHGVDAAEVIGSYLDIHDVLAAAARAGADAVHPGYGFLAESSAFATAVTDAGLLWIGPPPAAIAAMGDKAEARRRAAAHGTPVLAGYDGDDQGDARLESEARRIGFPLLVKPSAGGGGKGMRAVHEPGELAEAIAGARREAQRAFGDDRLILERYLAGSRHVEIQVLFDRYGAGVHLGERDCSTQRRNQKIVEEAPAPALAPGLRDAMGQAALAVAASVGYANAGTVEMLLADDGTFAFLEMNTRLQVEHPVTEAVTGRDLVADQLRIAAGEPLDALGLTSPPPLRGHAIEARLYAEDPDAEYLPSSGRLALVDWPPAARVDTAIVAGDLIGDRFDPMLAKLVVHAATRDEAVELMRQGLAGTTVLGVRTNLRLLRWLFEQPAMRLGRMRTDTLGALALPPPAAPSDEDWQAAAAAVVDDRASEPWGGAWRLNAPASVRLRCGDVERSVALRGSSRLAGAGDHEQRPPPLARDGDVVHVEVEGQSLEFRLAAAPTVEDAARHAAASAGVGRAMLTAPMPGRIAAVRAIEGEAVSAHQPLVLLEAMKMEHAVVSPVDGTLARLLVGEGQQVQRGELLAEVEPQPAPHDAADG